MEVRFPRPQIIIAFSRADPSAADARVSVLPLPVPLMSSVSHLLFRLLAIIALVMPSLASGQTLSITNDVQTHATLANTAVSLSGRAELGITGTGDPIAGCTINLTSEDAWFFMTNILPSTVTSTFLGRVQVNGAAAV